MEGWSGIVLQNTTATGNLSQIYPLFCPQGFAKPGTVGQNINHPSMGRLGAVQVETDSTSGGIIQIWDVNGEDLTGLDVSTSTPSAGTLPQITNTQLLALIALGKAKLIYEQNFTSTAGAVTPAAFGRGFLKGLAARYISAAPSTCSLNLTVEGGFYCTTAVGL